ncbi:MAG: SH3 domain-containing protein [Clostridia bacterium]|nr:SH3 domain-containing protein [Clostridia bacterium]
MSYNYRIEEMRSIVYKHLKTHENLVHSDKPPINVKGLCVEEKYLPLIEEINTLLIHHKYNEIEKIADTIIKDQTDSATGWFIKYIALTNHLTPSCYTSDNHNENFLLRGITEIKNKASETATHKNSTYILDSINLYEQQSVKYTEINVCSRALIFFDRTLKETSNDSLPNLEATARRNAAISFAENPYHEKAAKDNPKSLVICAEYTLLYLNNINFKKQCDYYGVDINADVADYINQKPISELQTTEVSLVEQMNLFGFSPEQSKCTETDGYISTLLFICDLLKIDPGNLVKYYSASVHDEIEASKKAEEELRLAAQRKKEEEELKLKEKEERKKRAEITKLKAKKSLIKFSKLLAVIISISVVIALINNHKDDIADFFDSLFPETTTSIYEKSEYYVMSDDYEKINIRTGAGTDSPVICVLDSREVKMFPTGMENGNWIEVDSPDFGIGWVSKKVIKHINE